ncbi:ankyrin repeat-containing domain protein [Podospora aff. communis PSN243]|uniref:Ankyrin repeat-containing domain protein n=1 Tax=Podospora aff. communis PSN243 TaxID=3040156 RepID=A0AAV9GKR9_9PEZI|nr:ankyrin repeat-containing domain protein [Podospora aff. communis PSN243]
MAKDWAAVHKEIRRLYEEEGKPLHEVMRLVRGKFGFIASERSYRTQLKSWGYTKYSTESSPKPAKKRVKKTTVLPLPAARSHALPSMSQNDISGPSNVTVPTSLPDFSSFVGDGILFNTTHDSSPSGGLPSYNQFSIAQQLSDSQPFPQASQRADEKTPLHDAVIENNYDSVKSFLFSGDAVEVRDASGNTPLHYAVLADSFEIVKLLLQFGADVNAKGQLGRTPLHRAVTTSQESPATQFSRPLGFRHPLPQTRVLELLIREGANSAAQDDKGDTPLHLAVGGLNGAMDDNSYHPRTPPVIEALLKTKPDFNIRNTMGATPFLKFFDMSTGNSTSTFQLISMFLKAGASVVMALPDGRTPLACFLHSYAKEWATMPRYATNRDREIRKECHTALRDLLDAGASVKTRTSAGDPMVVEYFRTQYTSWDADLTLAEKLCDLCSPDSTFEGGNTILHELAANRVAKAGKHCGTPGLIDIVVGKGANVNQRNDQGETPLMAIFTGKRRTKSDLAEQAMSALLRHGADPRLMDTRNRHVVLEAGKAFPKELRAFLGPLFRAYISMTVKDGQPPPSSPQSRASSELKWLSSWESTVRRNFWGVTKTTLSRDFASGELAVDTNLLVMAYTALAEHLVQGIVKQHDDGLLEKEQARTQVSEILRTCRERSLPVEMIAYDSLLELC